MKSSVLVIDDDPVCAELLSQTLVEADLSPHVETSGEGALAYLKRPHAAADAPEIVLLDLNMPHPDGFDVLRYLKSVPELASVPVVVVASLSTDGEIRKAFAAGADDFVNKPFRSAEIVARVRAQLRLREYFRDLKRREREQQAVLELTQALASSLDIHEILFTVTRRVADVAHVDRCSIVLAGDTPDAGFVVASSDNETIGALPISLRNYPEIREVLSTQKPLVIEDAAAHPLLDKVRHSDVGLGYSSVALIPIVHEGRATGTIFLRAKHTTTFSDEHVAVVQTIANTTGIALHNARILQNMQDETREMSHARVEAERRVQMFQRYVDFFQSAADGMIVMDQTGRILFTNPRAREITGYTETELMTLRFERILTPHEGERVQRLLRGFQDGVYPRGVDLSFLTSDDATVIANVSFSSVLHEDNAILFTFRDVSRERKTAIELKQTKEFLERVIDSSVDAIVVADLKGRLQLYNRAASRIFGYDPNDVVGKLAVERLYPPGVARQVMQKIRDPELGGYGRLEDYRVDMLNMAGEPIPVLLSAALVMENARPIGSVGIFTDIRNHLRMEAELQRTQEELRAREKQAIVAELAGAAAHELNQPLTSVMGYAELLQRKIGQGVVARNEELMRAASIIVSESERMAEIVRKVGKITKYETTTYVGGARILDLDKASDVNRS